jgi:hypothetical protein
MGLSLWQAWIKLTQKKKKKNPVHSFENNGHIMSSKFTLKDSLHLWITNNLSVVTVDKDSNYNKDENHLYKKAIALMHNYRWF